MVLVGGAFVAFCTANDILARYLFCAVPGLLVLWLHVTAALFIGVLVSSSAVTLTQPNPHDSNHKPSVRRNQHISIPSNVERDTRSHAKPREATLAASDLRHFETERAQP